MSKKTCIFAASKKQKMEKRVVFKFAVDSDMSFDMESLRNELVRSVSEHFGSNIDIKHPVVEVDTIYGKFPDIPFHSNVEDYYQC